MDHVRLEDQRRRVAPAPGGRDRRTAAAGRRSSRRRQERAQHMGEDQEQDGRPRAPVNGPSHRSSSSAAALQALPQPHVARDGHTISVLERDAARCQIRPSAPRRLAAHHSVPRFERRTVALGAFLAAARRRCRCLDTSATVGDPLDFMPPTIRDHGRARRRALPDAAGAPAVLEQTLARITDADRS